MRLFILSIFLLLPTLLWATPVENIERLQALNRQLRAEMDLARKSQLYVIVNLDSQQIELKTSGLVVADLKILKQIHWGKLPDVGVYQLVAKEAAAEPQREQIKPQPVEQTETGTASAPPATTESAPKKFELQALEIDDMPGRYTLHLDDGQQITVRAEEGGAISWIGSLLARCWWYLSRPLISLWSYFSGTPYKELILTMPLRDARQLYWSFTPGTSCQIVRSTKD